MCFASIFHALLQPSSILAADIHACLSFHAPGAINALIYSSRVLALQGSTVGHLLKAPTMDLALRTSDCNSASFSRMCRAYDSDPGLGGLHMMPIAICPVTFGDRLIEHSLYISSDTLQSQ